MAVDVPRDVHAQEREAGIGHRIDHPAHGKSFRRFQAEIGAPEWNDPRIVGSGSSGKAIRPQASAGDHQSCRDDTATGVEMAASAIRDGPDSGVETGVTPSCSSSRLRARATAG